MYAVLIEVDVTGVEREEGIGGLRDRIVPAIRAMPGFVSGTWLTGNENGRGLSLTVWDSGDHARAFAERFSVGASPQAGAAVERCEIREVAVLA
jgi:heme-degrading monooxygenase HmoA